MPISAMLARKDGLSVTSRLKFVGVLPSELYAGPSNPIKESAGTGVEPSRTGALRQARSSSDVPNHA